MSASWKLTLACTRAEAEDAAAAEIDGVVLVATEEDEGTARWRLDAYFDGEPAPALVGRVRELAASGGWSRAQPAPLADQDWVTLSQAGLEPIREGRFVIHTAAHPAQAPAGGRAFRVEAGQAFGTGHHATTAGCLAMLDGLADRRFARVIDLGTGTGLLAFAARHLWPDAGVTATDIDPVAIAVAAENAAANAVDDVRLLVADGTGDPAIAAGGPYDLIVANILAGPLIAMAPEVAAVAAPGATIVLAGLLAGQRAAVAAAYAACGCTEDAALVRGDWPVLRLMAGTVRFAPGEAFDQRGRDGWALDR
jgi:ribosomal protein L11 methyltransferase